LQLTGRETFSQQPLVIGGRDDLDVVRLQVGDPLLDECLYRRIGHACGIEAGIYLSLLHNGIVLAHEWALAGSQTN
jgi:hypothetical protein